jgi:DNA repair protein RAD16
MIDLEAPSLELEMPAAPRQGILGRLNIDTWRSSSKIEALVEELTNLHSQDATTKSIVFSQFVNFLDLIAFRLKRAGFSVNYFLHQLRHWLMATFRYAGLRVR